MHHASALLLSLTLALCPNAEGDSNPGAVAEQDAAKQAFDQLMQSQGLRLDLEQGLLGVPVRVAIKDDALEYLLVGPEGKAYESLLETHAKPSVINAALLALGAKPGKNADWIPPTEESEPELILPAGDGFYLYAAWRVAHEVYLFRIEDLITNVYSGRSMQRHRFIFLGSRFASPREGEPEVFVADVAQNLINLSFFYSGNTLLTAALPECQEQANWTSNGPLLPEREAGLELIFSKQALRFLPLDWEQGLPLVSAASDASILEDGH